MGSIAFAKTENNMGWIGLYWMLEDYRHSGIGTQLFNYAKSKLKGRNIGMYGGE